MSSSAIPNISLDLDTFLSTKKHFFTYYWGLPWWLSSKEFAYNAGDASLIPGLGRSLGGGNGNSLQSSCLGNPMDRGA